MHDYSALLEKRLQDEFQAACEGVQAKLHEQQATFMVWNRYMIITLDLRGRDRERAGERQWGH